MFVINEKYSFEKLNNDLIAINGENEKFIILGEIEQEILKLIITMTEEEVVNTLAQAYNDNGMIGNDVHEFVESLINEEILLKIEND